ncbi:MAG: hypothetical protein HY713_12940 [candidate division NC10 bacterium]|nr:hypothetical protein [candidate division NC10 bacterium]
MTEDTEKSTTPDAAPQEGKTAILVIHGIGQQDPYETLDSFGRGFVDHFRGQFSSAGGSNSVREIRPVRHNHGTWTEVALRLRFEKPATDRGLQELHLHEYYWAPHTQGRVTYRVVLNWLIRTVLTPLRYLSQNLHEEWTVSGGKLTTVGAVFAREVIRICLLYLPVLLVVGYLVYALASLPDLKQVFSPLLSAWQKEPRWIPLTVSMLAATVSVVLMSFMLGTAWRLGSQRGTLIQREAEIAWFLQAGFWTLVFLLLAFAVTAAFWPIEFLRTLWERLHSWDSAWNFLRGKAWPLAKTVLLFGIILYLRRVLVDYVGDIAVYVTADEKAEHYKARSQILKESTEALRRLLASDENYDRVIVAGHSLGSVIAYDTINRLLDEHWSLRSAPGPVPALTRDQIAKLQGLVTFGSPLDKIYYFFRRQVDEDQAIRAQILSFLYGFRRGRSFRKYGNYTLTFGPPGTPEGDASSHPSLGDQFRWLNVWARMDPVSGFLDHYVLVPQDQLSRPYLLWGTAHLAYWRDPVFYRFVAERLL